MSSRSRLHRGPSQVRRGVMGRERKHIAGEGSVSQFGSRAVDCLHWLCLSQNRQEPGSQMQEPLSVPVFSLSLSMFGLVGQSSLPAHQVVQEPASRSHNDKGVYLCVCFDGRPVHWLKVDLYMSGVSLFTVSSRKTPIGDLFSTVWDRSPKEIGAARRFPRRSGRLTVGRRSIFL